MTDGDWAAVARGADAKASEAAIIANTASILGDEAYTALGLKAQFEAATGISPVDDDFWDDDGAVRKHARRPSRTHGARPPPRSLRSD